MAQATKRINTELLQLRKEPVEGVSEIELTNDNLFEWRGCLFGPVGSPYEGGKFTFEIKYPENFPFRNPSVQFKTKIYHPNFDEEGNICIGLLKSESWKPTTRISQILRSLIQLLIEPNPDDPLVTSIAELYRNDRDEFNNKAKEFTKEYASV